MPSAEWGSQILVPNPRWEQRDICFLLDLALNPRQLSSLLFAVALERPVIGRFNYSLQPSKNGSAPSPTHPAVVVLPDESETASLMLVLSGVSVGAEQPNGKIHRTPGTTVV